jgi:acetyltransferase-like isoleucine patch superfamily enzyme
MVAADISAMSTMPPRLADLIPDPELQARAGDLRRLYQELRGLMWERWKRDLPLEELLFDRWERARQLGFGERSSIYHNSYVYGDVTVGRESWIGPFCLLDGSGGLDIGEFCSISAGVQIYTHDTVKWALTSGKAPFDHAPVRIGASSHIGAQTVVVKGVEIGDHCVVGANSFVNRDLAPFTVAVGSPARAIGRVELENGVDVRIVLNQQKGNSAIGAIGTERQGG